VSVFDIQLPPSVTLAYCLGTEPSIWAIDFETNWAAMRYPGASIEIHTDDMRNLFLWVIADLEMLL
jgi:hypothetical protein